MLIEQSGGIGHPDYEEGIAEEKQIKMERFLDIRVKKN